MGVRGLSSFFDMNPDLSLEYKLYNNHVIIDGNNLVYMLYFNSRLDCIYGGDYDRFATSIKEYFLLLLQCDIKPLVVFDGGYDISERKIQTTQERLRQRLSITQQIAKYGTSSERILPILAHEVFKNVLEEIGIPQTQCDYEADDQIVALANHFQCPVISQDSDFYIFDIPNGFIRVDSVHNTVYTETTEMGCKYNYLKCKIYYVNNFLSHFPGIDKAVLPLFGTLIGNDFVNIKTFETFFCNMRMPKIRSRKLRINKRHRRMIGLLAWLQNHELQEAIEHVLSCLKKKNRENIRELIQSTMDGYKKCKTNLIQCLDNEKLNINEEQVAMTAVMSFTGKPLPGWFVMNFHKGILAPFLLNAVGLHRAFLPCQVEESSYPSSYFCSKPLRQIIYGLLMSHDEDIQNITIEPQKQNRLKCIEEYDRKHKSFQKQYIEPIYHISGFGSLPTLDSLSDLKSELQKKLILTLLDSKEDHLLAFPTNLQLLIAVMRYWLKNSSPKPKEDFFWATVLCIIFVSVVQPCTKSKSEDGDQQGFRDSIQNNQNDIVEINKDSLEITFEKIKNMVSIEEACNAQENLQKFYQKPQHNNAKPIIMDAVHSYSQLQTCLLFSLHLNKLLGNPFENPKFHNFFAGTVIYAITRELLIRPVPDLYISELLGRESVLHKLYLILQEAILFELPSDCLERTDRQPLKKKKRRKKGRQKHHVEEDIISTDEAVQSNCFDDITCPSNVTELSNQFDTLHVNLKDEDSVDIFL